MPFGWTMDRWTKLLESPRTATPPVRRHCSQRSVLVCPRSVWNKCSQNRRRGSCKGSWRRNCFFFYTIYLSIKSNNGNKFEVNCVPLQLNDMIGKRIENGLSEGYYFAFMEISWLLTVDGRGWDGEFTKRAMPLRFVVWNCEIMKRVVQKLRSLFITRSVKNMPFCSGWGLKI